MQAEMNADWDLRRLAQWRGSEVVAADDHTLGKLNGIVYDVLSSEPVWLSIATGLMHLNAILAPVPAATPVAAGKLRVGYTSAELEDQPEASLGEGFSSETEQQELCEYFDMPFDPSRDLRVLHEGEDLPGLEVNIS